MLSPMCFYHPRWPVFFEDNHLLALFKPAGLLAQGDRSGAVCLLELAKGWLRKRHAKPGRVFLGLVHRLDRPVAGVMLFARTSKAAARLSAQFRCGTIQKTYLAVVEGTPAQPNGNLYDHIERQGLSCRILSEPSGHSREARLQYRLIDSTGDRSLLQVAPETGRRHQIRAQLSLTGHPVWGDVKYGAQRRTGLEGIGLHAAFLEVAHPVGGATLVFEAPVPAHWPWPRNEE